MPFRMEFRRQQKHGDQDRRDARTCKNGTHHSHEEREESRKHRRLLLGETATPLREVDEENAEHGESERKEDERDHHVEPGIALNLAEGHAADGGENAHDAVGERNAETVERTACGGLADDHQVDRHHRQHAGRQVHRQAAEQNQKKSQQESAQPAVRR